MHPAPHSAYAPHNAQPSETDAYEQAGRWHGLGGQDGSRAITAEEQLGQYHAPGQPAYSADEFHSAALAAYAGNALGPSQQQRQPPHQDATVGSIAPAAPLVSALQQDAPFAVATTSADGWQDPTRLSLVDLNLARDFILKRSRALGLQGGFHLVADLVPSIVSQLDKHKLPSSPDRLAAFAPDMMTVPGTRPKDFLSIWLLWTTWTSEVIKVPVVPIVAPLVVFFLLDQVPNMEDRMRTAQVLDAYRAAVYPVVATLGGRPAPEILPEWQPRDWEEWWEMLKTGTSSFFDWQAVREACGLGVPLQSAPAPNPHPGSVFRLGAPQASSKLASPAHSPPVARPNPPVLGQPYPGAASTTPLHSPSDRRPSDPALRYSTGPRPAVPARNPSAPYYDSTAAPARAPLAGYAPVTAAAPQPVPLRAQPHPPSRQLACIDPAGGTSASGPRSAPPVGPPVSSATSQAPERSRSVGGGLSLGQGPRYAPVSNAAPPPLQSRAQSGLARVQEHLSALAVQAGARIVNATAASVQPPPSQIVELSPPAQQRSTATGPTIGQGSASPTQQQGEEALAPSVLGKRRRIHADAVVESWKRQATAAPAAPTSGSVPAATPVPVALTSGSGTSEKKILVSAQDAVRAPAFASSSAAGAGVPVQGSVKQPQPRRKSGPAAAPSHPPPQPARAAAATTVPKAEPTDQDFERVLADGYDAVRAFKLARRIFASKWDKHPQKREQPLPPLIRPRVRAPEEVIAASPWREGGPPVFPIAAPTLDLDVPFGDSLPATTSRAPFQPGLPARISRSADPLFSTLPWPARTPKGKLVPIALKATASPWPAEARGEDQLTLTPRLFLPWSTALNELDDASRAETWSYVTSLERVGREHIAQAAQAEGAKAPQSAQLSGKAVKLYVNRLVRRAIQDSKVDDIGEPRQPKLARRIRKQVARKRAEEPGSTAAAEGSDASRETTVHAPAASTSQAPADTPQVAVSPPKKPTEPASAPPTTQAFPTSAATAAAPTAARPALAGAKSSPAVPASTLRKRPRARSAQSLRRVSGGTDVHPLAHLYASAPGTLRQQLREFSADVRGKKLGDAAPAAFAAAAKKMQPSSARRALSIGASPRHLASKELAHPSPPLVPFSLPVDGSGASMPAERVGDRTPKADKQHDHSPNPSVASSGTSALGVILGEEPAVPQASEGDAMQTDQTMRSSAAGSFPKEPSERTPAPTTESNSGFASALSSAARAAGDILANAARAFLPGASDSSSSPDGASTGLAAKPSGGVARPGQPRSTPAISSADPAGPSRSESEPEEHRRSLHRLSSKDKAAEPLHPCHLRLTAVQRDWLKASEPFRPFGPFPT